MMEAQRLRSEKYLELAGVSGLLWTSGQGAKALTLLLFVPDELLESRPRQALGRFKYRETLCIKHMNKFTLLHIADMYTSMLKPGLNFIKIK